MDVTPGATPPVAPLFTTLADPLAAWRTHAPDAPALIGEHRTWTAGDLADLVDAQAHAVAARTAAGDRVAMHLANAAEAVALLYAVPASGRTLVPLNTRLTDAEKADQCHRARVALLVGDPVTGFDGPTVPVDELADPGERVKGSPPRSAPDPDGVAWCIFTSGSTGRPKGALVTHASLAAAVATTAAARPLADDEVYLYPFPLFHVAAYNVVHAHARRRPVVLPDRFDARRIVELCHTHRVTNISVAATMLRMLLDDLDTPGSPGPPPSLRTVSYGAAPMPEGLLRTGAQTLGCGFAQGYGSTELSGNAVFLGPEAHRQSLAGDTRLRTAAGYAGPGVQLRVVDSAGEVLPPGRAGELSVAAAQVCAGYLDDAEATAASFRDGWLHTGDVAVLDDDGLVHIVDRAKDVVVTGGENVASREVEDVLRTHPAVGDVAVVGTPDDHWGEAVTAVVVPADPAREPTDPARPTPAPDRFADELRRHVAAHLAGYKKPRRVWLVSALPVNANGKIDKPALRARLTHTGLPGGA